MKGDKRTSPNKIYDVAGAAGVSLATVSRVLNHPEKVKPATREKIERIIKELGYKPNLNAKGLASSKSTTVAVVVPELTRSSIAGMVDGIAATAIRRGYLIRLFVNNSSNSENPVSEEQELWRTVMSSGVDGILYINDEIADEYLEIIKESSVSVVLTNTVCSDPEIPSVAIDYKKAAYEMTKEMIERGNKTIWIISTIKKYAVNDLKVQGYEMAMKEAGLEPRIINVSGKTYLNEKAYEEILKDEYPNVAIVVRDSMAVSFINVARQLHISIPDQLQVIGFQNTKYAELSRPTLTCINTPIYEIGEVAMDLLTDLMHEAELEEEYYNDFKHNDDKNEDLLEEEKIEINKNVDYSIVWRQSTK